MKLGFLKNNLRDYGLLLSLVVIMGFFQYQTDGVLMQLSWGNPLLILDPARGGS